MLNDAAPPTTDPQPTGSSSTPPTGPAAAPTEWRVPDTDPRTWARGKTATELLNITEQLAVAAQSLAAQPQPSAQPTYQGPQIAPLADDELIDGKRMREILSAVVANQPRDNGTTAAALAQMAYAQAKQSDPETFRAYGPEIDIGVSQLPVELRTLDNIQRIVKLVRAEHIEELAERRARDIAAGQGLSVRTTGAASGYPGARGAPLLESDELPAPYRELLAKKGVTEAQVRDFCRANGMSVEQWMKSAKNHTTMIGEE